MTAVFPRRPFLIHASGALVLLSLTVCLNAQTVLGKHEVRYKIEFNLDSFPQKTPEESLKSVVQAIANRRFDYLTAQLALPSQVDASVQRIADTVTMGSEDDRKLVGFFKVVEATERYYRDDPNIFKELRLVAEEGKWDTTKKEVAIGTHKDLPGRKVYLHHLEGRWFLDNRQK